MTHLRLQLCRTLFALLCLVTPFVGRAQILGDDAPPLLNTVASIPLTVELGDENVIARRVGLRFGGALYPLPLLIDRELNIDAFADVTYTLRGSVGNFLANSSVALYTGAGPRYRLVNSELFLDGEDPSSYWGAGILAGADFRLGIIGLSLVSAFAEAGSDYVWPSGEGLSAGHWSPRIRVGLGIPLVGGLAREF